MLKANTKYTVEEILTEAGFNPEMVGKVRVRIGGIPVNKHGHIIRIVEEGKLVVLAGTESKEVDIVEASEELTVSPETKKALEAKGAEMSKKIEEREKASEELAKKIKE
jgi:hypothetical protein